MGASVAAGAVAAVAGCSGSGTSGSGGRAPRTGAGGKPELSWKGTITMAAQAYTPALPGVKMAPGSAKLTEFGKAADAFTKIYPGIKIKFLGSDYNLSPETMKTRATGGQLPDIWWQQSSTVNTAFPSGVATNLAEVMQRPNAFIDGNDRWRDVLNERAYTSSARNATTQYCNNGDFVATAFFYNKAYFAKAGISEPPKTYRDLLDVCEKLKSAGYTPTAFQAYVYGLSWLGRIFLTNALGEDVAKQIESYSGGTGVNTTGLAVAYKKGILDPRKNPKVLGWWPVAKELFAYCDPQISQLPATPPAGSPTLEGVLSAGKVAMVYDGTWATSAVKAAGSDVELGSFPFPSLTGTSEYANDFDTSNACGGAAAAWQYFVSTPRSDRTLREKGKLDAVTAWMQFFSTPEWNTAICNELGSFLPTFKGAKPDDSMASLAAMAEKRIYAVDPASGFTTEMADQLNKLFQGYVLGQVTLDQVKQKYPVIVDKSFNEYIAANPIDFSKYQ